MRLLKYLILGYGIFTLSFLNAQDDKTLVTIGGENVSVDDFMYVYKKNNTIDGVLDKKSFEEYLELYINFKLKVKEAEELGYDTASAFTEELDGYRDQLAEPYFANEDIIEDLLKEAYERKKEDVRASHILVKVGPDAMPKDTLIAYNKIIDAKKRIDRGENFADVAKEVSEDPSAKDRYSQRAKRDIPGNGGDLGYFTVFDMVYQFEVAAYSTPVGELSNPVRTDFGYHLIKTTDKIQAMGSIEVAHLFLKMPDSASAQDSINVKMKIDSLYQKINNGEEYDDLVKEYSDDKGSASRNGLLPKFNVNRMVPEFIQEISTMKDSGDVSKPVLTSYGWHLIKLYSKSGIKSFEDVEEDMRKRIEKDSRAQKSKDVIINDIKKEYGFKRNDEALEKIYEIVDTTIYKKKWEVPEIENLSSTLFTLGDKSFMQIDFANYIAANQTISNGGNIGEFINSKYKEFIDFECKAYENARLEDKYPDFKAIMKEYRDGILLFELTNEKIWSYATKDTVGLKNYFEQHKKEFLWEVRLDASIYTFNDTGYINKARELVNNGYGDEEILYEINKDSLDIVKIKRKKYQKEDNDLIDSIKWKKGITDNIKDGGKEIFIIVHEKIAPEPKTFNEARGLITAGYQEYLEEEWIKELRLKYPVEINEEVLSSLTN